MTEINSLKESDLLALPEEVLDTYIFSFLRYADLLRLRRVCKYLKSLSDTFILSNFQSHYREINETNYTFHHYLQSNLTTTSIYLNNSSPSFFQNPDIPTFLHFHVNKIISLKVNHFATFISEHELFFFSNFPNLLHLEINFIDASSRDCLTNIKLVNGIPVLDPNAPFPLPQLRDKSPFPPSFKNLKTLKLNSVLGSSPDDYGYPWDFLEFCENLQHFKHPLYILDGGSGFYNHHAGNLGWMMDYVTSRANQNGLPNLETYDMEHFQPNRFCTRFNELVSLCFHNNVKLMNVPHLLLAAHPELCFGLGQQVNGCFLSLRNLPWVAVKMEMPNLEKLVIEKISKTDWMNVNEGEAKEMVAQWPVLKTLDLNIDSAEFERNMGHNEEFELPEFFGFRMRRPVTQDVLDFLFFPKPGNKFDELRNLAVRFPLGLLENQVSVPSVRNITETCGFVTKLTLGNWLGTEEQVWGFWEGLRLLEEVVLEECGKLGDKAFLGADGREVPLFLKLTKLRKLSLKGLDKMPKITDELFKLVLRHLTIKQFCLTSEMPVKSVTVSGIESLLTGSFNESVEKFPFTGWSLDGVSDTSFSQLKLKFRASQMI